MTTREAADYAEAVDYAKIVKFCETAMAALEKQIPKKPTQDLRKGLECGCPICGAYVGWRDAMASDLANFCSDCGQKLLPGDKV